MHVVYLDKCLLHISVCRADRLLFCLWGDCHPFRQYSCHVPVVLSDAFPFYLLLFCVGCEQGVHMSWHTGASNTFHALSGQVCECCPLPTEPGTPDALLRNATEWVWWQMSLVPALGGKATTYD